MWTKYLKSQGIWKMFTVYVNINCLQEPCVGVLIIIYYFLVRAVFIILQGRAHIFKIHARSMSVERDIRYELLARLCPNTTGL